MHKKRQKTRQVTTQSHSSIGSIPADLVAIFSISIGAIGQLWLIYSCAARSKEIDSNVLSYRRIE